MADKGPRVKVMFASTGKNKNGNPTGTVYMSYRNKRNTPDKLELTKFDPLAWDEKAGKPGKRVLFKEKKIPK